MDKTALEKFYAQELMKEAGIIADFKGTRMKELEKDPDADYLDYMGERGATAFTRAGAVPVGVGAGVGLAAAALGKKMGVPKGLIALNSAGAAIGGGLMGAGLRSVGTQYRKQMPEMMDGVSQEMIDAGIPFEDLTEKSDNPNIEASRQRYMSGLKNRLNLKEASEIKPELSKEANLAATVVPLAALGVAGYGAVKRKDLGDQIDESDDYEEKMELSDKKKKYDRMMWGGGLGGLAGIADRRRMAQFSPAAIAAGTAVGAGIDGLIGGAINKAVRDGQIKKEEKIRQKLEQKLQSK